MASAMENLDYVTTDNLEVLVPCGSSRYISVNGKDEVVDFVAVFPASDRSDDGTESIGDDIKDGEEVFPPSGNTDNVTKHIEDAITMVEDKVVNDNSIYITEEANGNISVSVEWVPPDKESRITTLQADDLLYANEERFQTCERAILEESDDETNGSDFEPLPLFYFKWETISKRRQNKLKTQNNWKIKRKRGQNKISRKRLVFIWNNRGEKKDATTRTSLFDKHFERHNNVFGQKQKTVRRKRRVSEKCFKRKPLLKLFQHQKVPKYTKQKSTLPTCNEKIIMNKPISIHKRCNAFSNAEERNRCSLSKGPETYVSHSKQINHSVIATESKCPPTVQLTTTIQSKRWGQKRSDYHKKCLPQRQVQVTDPEIEIPKLDHDMIDSQDLILVQHPLKSVTPEKYQPQHQSTAKPLTNNITIMLALMLASADVSQFMWSNISALAKTVTIECDKDFFAKTPKAAQEDEGNNGQESCQLDKGIEQITLRHICKHKEPHPLKKTSSKCSICSIKLEKKIMNSDLQKINAEHKSNQPGSKKYNFIRNTVKHWKYKGWTSTFPENKAYMLENKRKCSSGPSSEVRQYIDDQVKNADILKESEKILILKDLEWLYGSLQEFNPDDIVTYPLIKDQKGNSQDDSDSGVVALSLDISKSDSCDDETARFSGTMFDQSTTHNLLLQEQEVSTADSEYLLRNVPSESLEQELHLQLGATGDDIRQSHFVDGYGKTLKHTPSHVVSNTSVDGLEGGAYGGLAEGSEIKQYRNGVKCGIKYVVPKMKIINNTRKKTHLDGNKSLFNSGTNCDSSTDKRTNAPFPVEQVTLQSNCDVKTNQLFGSGEPKSCSQMKSSNGSENNFTNLTSLYLAEKSKSQNNEHSAKYRDFRVEEEQSKHSYSTTVPSTYLFGALSRFTPPTKHAGKSEVFTIEAEEDANCSALKLTSKSLGIVMGNLSTSKDYTYQVDVKVPNLKRLDLVPGDSTDVLYTKIKPFCKSCRKHLPLLDHSIKEGSTDDLVKFIHMVENEPLAAGGIIIQKDLKTLLKRLNQFSESFTVMKPLGRGTYGTAYLCHAFVTESDENIQFVKKQIPRRLFNVEEVLIPLLHATDCKQILEIYGVYIQDDYVNVLMEYAKGGTITSVLRNPECKWGISHIVTLMKVLLEGVKYLHSKDIVVYDMKTYNVVLRDDRDPQSVAIIDWGSSKCKSRISENTPINHRDGTAQLLPPEFDWNRTIKGFPDSLMATDMWCLGTVLYWGVSGCHIWNERWRNICTTYHDSAVRKSVLREYITGHRYEIYHSISDLVPQVNHPIIPTLKHLLTRLLDPDPDTRISASDALKHPIFADNRKLQIPSTVEEQNRTYLKTSVPKFEEQYNIIPTVPDTANIWITVVLSGNIIYQKYKKKGTPVTEIYQETNSEIQNIIQDEEQGYCFLKKKKNVWSIHESCVLEVRLTV